MKILITGADGFIGKNLIQHLLYKTAHHIFQFKKGDSLDELFESINNSDLVIHLAATNRASNDSDFINTNQGLTEIICREIEALNSPIPIIFTSSLQATHLSPYGKSKRLAEVAIENHSMRTKASAVIYRLPGVFGKWCKPNYNSVVATFCHNIAHNLPIDIHEPEKSIPLIYIDDLIQDLLGLISALPQGLTYRDISPEYSISLRELAEVIQSFKKNQSTINLPSFCNPIVGRLYSTFLSYLPIAESSYQITGHPDHRGTFVEMMKLPDAGQISYLTAKPGVTRGGHFHHSKSEKFLVVKGSAKFRFSNVLSNEKYEINASEQHLQIVQTLPGWAHDITNIGNEEMIAIVWSNEIFDQSRPDTIRFDL